MDTKVHKEKEWEQRYFTLLQNMLNGYVLYEVEVDEDGDPADLTVLDVNRAFEQITGLRRSAAVGRKMSELYPDIFEGEFDFISILGQAAITGDSIRIDQYLHFLQQWHTLAAYSPRPGQLVVLFADITQMKRLSGKHADQMHFFQEVLAALPNPLLYRDTGGFIADCNCAFSRLVGLPKQEIIGRHYGDVLPKPVYNRMLSTQAALQRKAGTQVYDYRMSGADGSVRDMVFHETVIQDRKGATDGTLGVMVDVTERKRIEEQMAYQVHHDLLTGLPNRRLYEERLRLALIQAKRSKALLAIAALDLEGIKYINERMGHDTGDLVLQEVAQRLKLCLREGDTVARTGGDDFLLLLPGLDEYASSVKITDRILSALQKPFVLEGREVWLNGNIGISFYPRDAEEAAGLLQKTEWAMRRARSIGGGTVCYSGDSD